MNKDTFLNEVANLAFGKKLPESVYLHRDALNHIENSLSEFVQRIANVIKLKDKHWNLVKLHKNQFRISYLHYPAFFEEAYPALQKSFTVDLTKKSVKESQYTESDNPPILHRKELFLPPDHDQIEACQHITQEGEQAGLYENTKIIGFKNSWERLIKSKGYTLVDGRLFRDSALEFQAPQSSKIDRHLTAIVRHDLSAPMKTLAKHGYLDGELTLFDYGCGRGDDLRELEAHGIDAAGWDPNFRPETERFNCDLVNIGFVINVIEDREERIEALLKAYQLADKLLVVSAMLGSESFISKFKPYKDGVITSRNTFQKYFSQTELQTFIELILDDYPISVGPGIFYIFKDKLEEQSFLEKRQKRHHKWRQLTTRPRSNQSKFESILEQNRHLLESFWQTTLSLGRLPTREAFDDYDELKEKVGSPKKTFSLLENHFDIDEFELAKRKRTEDLSVYFALSFFGKKKPYTQAPESLKQDIKAFFGNYNNALEIGKSLLYKISDPVEINTACSLAKEELVTGHFEDSNTYTFHKKHLNSLPVLLRIYVGCAIQMYGELDEIDLIKIHIRSGKCSFMGYEGFDTSPIPLLKERIKVKLAQQDIDFFDYVGDFKPSPLYFKSHYTDDSFDDYKKQTSFDKRLLDLTSENAYLPKTKPDLINLLKAKGLSIKGYRFYKTATT